jgi:hypothetical protein
MLSHGWEGCVEGVIEFVYRSETDAQGKGNIGEIYNATYPSTVCL